MYIRRRVFGSFVSIIAIFLISSSSVYAESILTSGNIISTLTVFAIMGGIFWVLGQSKARTLARAGTTQSRNIERQAHEQDRQLARQWREYQNLGRQRGEAVARHGENSEQVRAIDRQRSELAQALRQGAEELQRRRAKTKEDTDKTGKKDKELEGSVEAKLQKIAVMLVHIDKQEADLKSRYSASSDDKERKSLLENLGHLDQERKDLKKSKIYLEAEDADITKAIALADSEIAKLDKEGREIHSFVLKLSEIGDITARDAAWKERYQKWLDYSLWHILKNDDVIHTDMVKYVKLQAEIEDLLTLKLGTEAFLQQAYNRIQEFGKAIE